MANEQRKKHMLMATGDNGSVSWQPAFETPGPQHADRIVAGGYISGPSQPAAVARELLTTLRATDVRVPADFSSAAFFLVAASIAEGSELVLERVEVLSLPISDHLPVAVEIRLPDSLRADSLPVQVPERK